ncbi:hypothetical protein C4585_03515 [Candidatus Parcubacteria bacterium]|nr:MAG: hypothetical protein C4585_03515 [Candidatus Parcubacteria bacterium]
MVRYAHQMNNYYCGPAVIVTALRSYGIRVTQREAAKRAKTTKEKGTSTSGLVRALKSFGLRVHASGKSTLKDVRKGIGEGITVIVCYTEPKAEEGHYAVVMGFHGDQIYLASPDERGSALVAMPLKEFERRWKDPLYTHSRRWAAFITPPQGKRD